MASITAPRAQLEADCTSELTLDALMARMRSAAQRSTPMAPTRSASDPAGGERADAAALFQLQMEFNEELVAAVTSIAQYLRQSRIAEKPPAAAGMVTDLLPRIEALGAQVSDLAQRLDQAVAALQAADQTNRTLIDALVMRIDTLQQETVAKGQQAAAETERLQQHIATTQAALHQEFAAAGRRTDEQLAEIELRLFRAERDWHNKTQAAVTPGFRELSTGLNQALVSPESGPTPGLAADAVTPSPLIKASHSPFDYFLFEHRFRGPIEEIKQRQRAYLDYFLPAESVLDLGCGRGEFVELLVEHGVPVIGVDFSEDMVRFCRSRSLPVMHVDLFEYLAVQPDGSVGGIFVSQVVEHLPSERVWTLIQLAAAKLKTDGVLLLETINPQCFAAISCFYLDPSHVRPYHAGLLSFMCEQAGFRLECIQFSAPLPGSPTEAVLKSLQKSPGPEATYYQDYAVIARRSSLPVES